MSGSTGSSKLAKSGNTHASAASLTPLQLRGLNKLGDAMVPGDDEYPPFSRSGCTAALERVLAHMGPTDLADLRGLLAVMAILPAFLVRLFLALLELSAKLPDSVGGILRFARLGVRGLIFTLYYSNPSTLKLLGYDVSVYTGDLGRGGSGESPGQYTRGDPAKLSQANPTHR